MYLCPFSFRGSRIETKEQADPGCAVDIPAALYSLSFAPHPGFSKLCPSQAEVLDYFHEVAHRYRVLQHVACQTEWEGAQWQEDRQTWRVRMRDLVNGTVFQHECKILISAVGALVNPNSFDLPGVDSFRGEIVHTARWRDDLSLRGKDVVVVGNGGISFFSFLISFFFVFLFMIYSD